jgi:hypothetical protein
MTAPVPHPSDDPTHHDAVEAYCGSLSYAPGDELTLHVRCTTERFDVEISRWGATREVVWSATDLPGVEHPTPIDADARGCRWPAAVTFTIPSGASAWRSGFHHVRLRAHGAPHDRSLGHACFVLRSGDAPAQRGPRRALLVIATNTYNAYNSWGGRSLYTGATEVSFRRPFGRGMIDRPDAAPDERDDRKARPTRWGEAPDSDGVIYQQYRHARDLPGYMSSAGWFTYERRFVEWAEANGSVFDYATSSDLERVPGVLDGYDLVLSVGHDEYWSAGQRDALERYVAAGGNLASMSGNTMFWQVRLDEHGDSMVCHKYRAHLEDPVLADGRPSEMTGMWSDPMVGRPETAILGAGSAWGLYSRFGQATPRGAGAFTVYRDAHWLFAGTGLRYGDLLGARDGVVGYETVGCRLTFDEYQLPIAAGGDGTPPDIEVVGFCPSSNLMMGEYPASIAALDDQGDLEFVAERIHGRVDDDTIARVRHGNAVMVVCRPFGSGGGEVVTIGSTDWVYGLAKDPAVARVTQNVLDRFLVRPVV